MGFMIKFDFLQEFFGSDKKKEETPAPTASKAAEPKLGKSGKKICCSCPDTKNARDLCIVNNGEKACFDLIEAHKACLREEGFTIK